MRFTPAFNAAWNFVRANLAPLKVPVRVNCAVTYRCNSRCKTCNIWRRAEGPELSLDDYRRFFRLNRHLSCLSLTGGEVFLRSDLVEIVAAALGSCPGLYMINITTNGLLTATVVEAVRRILAMRPPSVCLVVSLDGPREVHDVIRGRAGSFDRSLETFRQLRNLRHPGLDLYAGMTVSGNNLGLVEATFTALRREIPDLRPGDFNVNLAHRSNHYYDNATLDLSFQQQAADEIRSFFRQYQKSYTTRNLLERVYHRYTVRYARTGRCPIRCRAADVSCYLDPGGQVYPCHIDSAPLATLQECGYRLAALGRQPGYRAARDRIRAGECEQCWTPCGAYDSLLTQIPRVFF